jgi:chorismate mutase
VSGDGRSHDGDHPTRLAGRRGARLTPELVRLRAEIDELDRRIVSLLNERAELTRAVVHEKAALGRRRIRDREREREVLLRISMANMGPIPQADLLSIYRRLIASARALEALEVERMRRDDEGPPELPGA